MVTSFINKLVLIAEEEYLKYHYYTEGDTQLCDQIRNYWIDLDLNFESCTAVPWSAVFVSWCIKQAGATSAEFKFAASHSVFVKEAIFNAIKDIGVFRGHEITKYKPKIGDVIQNNRGSNRFNYEYAKGHARYESHSALVIETGQDRSGYYALTVGGNEGNSIHQSIVRLDSEGFIQHREVCPYICVIENLK